MIKITITLFFSLFVVAVFHGQTIYECGTGDDPLPNTAGIYSKSISLDILQTDDPVVFDIFFWGVNRADGTSSRSLTEDQVLDVIARLNKAYNQFEVFFKYKGFSTFNSDTYYTTSSWGGLTTYAMANGYVQPNSFNVYVPWRFIGYRGIGLPNTTNAGVDADAFVGNTIVHEIGHNFGLLHTHKDYDSSVTSEHVTRDTANSQYNADYRGDEVTDTAATPKFFDQDYMDGTTVIDIDVNTCAYIAVNGFDRDCQFTDYELFVEDTTNYMSNTSDDCRSYLSPGQGVRLRETIDADVNAVFGQAMTTINSLYEPFKGDYYFAGPSLFDEDLPHFQPGFDYHFVECSCDCIDPSDYDDISFTFNSSNSIEYDKDYLGSILHRNHYAIIIDQVDPSQPRICQDNYNRTPIGGNVKRFNDGVFNYNVTDTPQDSTGINSPNLIQDLNSGLYKIEKILNGGFIEEEVIIKNNN